MELQPYEEGGLHIGDSTSVTTYLAQLLHSVTIKPSNKIIMLSIWTSCYTSCYEQAINITFFLKG